VTLRPAALVREGGAAAGPMGRRPHAAASAGSRWALVQALQPWGHGARWWGGGAEGFTPHQMIPWSLLRAFPPALASVFGFIQHGHGVKLFCITR